MRKQHDTGYKHKANVRAYYSQFEQEQTQNLIDEKIKQYEAGADMRMREPLIRRMLGALTLIVLTVTSTCLGCPAFLAAGGNRPGGAAGGTLVVSARQPEQPRRLG